MGPLVHAATVFPLGKAFLNALLATKTAIKPGQVGRLNLAARSELAWWNLLLEHWPGSSVYQFLLFKAAGSTHIHGRMQQDPGAAGHGRNHTGFTYSGAASGACRQFLSKNCYP